MDRFKIIRKTELEKLPRTTGIYCFIKSYRCRTPIDYIYIGKAINIQSRVKNHFQQPSYRDNLFIDKVDKIGFFETNNSEIEALILEANLIKKYQPKFNVVWRDDKNYFYVAIAKNKEKIPYVFITHQPRSSSLRGASEVSNEAIQSHRLPRRLRAPRNDSTQYIGPFTEGTALKKTLRFLRKVFPYYTSAGHSKNKCAYCHLDLCPGPQPDLVDYKKSIKKLILILQGKRSAVLSSLKKEMKNASKENKFEEAGKARDKIFALQQVMSHTRVINQEITHREKHAIACFSRWVGIKKIRRIECYDISNIQGKHATGSMVVFSAQGGPASGWVPDKSQYKKFKIRIKNTPNDIAMLKEILQRRFTHKDWPYPDAVLIDGGKAQFNVALEIKNYFKNLKIEKFKNYTVMSIAKGKQELFIEGQKNPIPLKQLPQEIYNLIKNLDDEAHRFAISYHKTLRKKNLLK